MTIAERVLKKLSELDEKLDSVYETANAIKDLKLTIERFQKEAEDTFSNQVARMDTAEQNNKELFEDYETALGKLNEQKNHLDLSIQALEQRKQELDETIESILTVYTDEQKKIDAALTLLGITKLDLSTLEEKLTQAFSGLDNTISNKLSKYIDALDSKLEPIVIGHLNKLDGEIARFKKEIDAKIDKNSNDKNEQLDGWINNKEVWFQTQQEESKKLIVQIKSSEANLTSKVNELTKQANE